MCQVLCSALCWLRFTSAGSKVCDAVLIWLAGWLAGPLAEEAGRAPIFAGRKGGSRAKIFHA